MLLGGRVTVPRSRNFSDCLHFCRKHIIDVVSTSVDNYFVVIDVSLITFLGPSFSQMVKRAGYFVSSTMYFSSCLLKIGLQQIHMCLFGKLWLLSLICSATISFFSACVPQLPSYHRPCSFMRRSFWTLFIPNSLHLSLFLPFRIGLVCITSWYPKFNRSHFGLPPSSIHRMTSLRGNFVWAVTYSHRTHFSLVILFPHRFSFFLFLTPLLSISSLSWHPSYPSL